MAVGNRKPYETKKRLADEVRRKSVAHQREIARLVGDDPDEFEEPKVSLDLSEISNGVSVPWLVSVFKQSRYFVTHKLQDLKPCRVTRKGTPFYDIAEASARLVKPKMSIEDVLNEMKPADLPKHLQSNIWTANLKRQKWEVNAGKLWHTNDIIDTLTDTFTILRDRMQLWVDALEKTTVTPDQRRILQGLVHDLQTDLHEQLVESAKTKKTYSQLADLEKDEDGTRFEVTEND